MAYVLSDIFSRSDCVGGIAPDDVKLEAEITMRMSSSVKDLEKLGTITPFTCPDCDTEKALESEKIKKLEESLRVAIRMLEERKNLLEGTTSEHVHSKIERVEQIEVHIDRLKNMLLDINENLDKKE